MKSNLARILPHDRSWRAAVIEVTKAKVFLERSKHGVGISVLPTTSPQTDAIDIWPIGFKTDTCRSLARCLRDGSSFQMGIFLATRIERGVRIDLSYKDFDREAFSILLLDDDFDFFMAILAENYLTIKSISRMNDESGQTGRGKIGRNEPCPCGSGKKVKKCCGMASSSESDQIEDSLLEREVDRLSEEGMGFVSRKQFAEARRSFEAASKLHPDAHGARQNLAVVMAQQGEIAEAIQLVRSIPDWVPRRAAILANLCQDQGSHSDAVGYYEIAIEEEPEFYLPYARIINSLKVLGSSTVEYWLRLGLARVPESAELGFQYARLLFDEGRHEELAEAGFVDRMKSEDRQDIIGNASKDELLIQNTRLLQLASRAIKNETEEDSTVFIDAFLRSKEYGKTCELAKIALSLSVSSGDPATTETCWNRICPDCIEAFNRVGTSLETMMTRMHFAAARYQDVIVHATLALGINPKDESSLEAIWYALDEVGRVEDAISRARELFELNPAHENIAYNLGWLYRKDGRYPSAAHFHDIQLSLQPDHYQAALSSALMHILGGEIDLAKSTWNIYEAILEVEISKETEEAGEEEVQDAKNFLRDQRVNWSRLIERANSEESPETKLGDLARLVVTNFGGNTGFPPRPLSTMEIFRSLQIPDSIEAKEALFNVQLQARGDTSLLVAQIRSELPGWENLPLGAQYSMIEAQKRISSQETARDFSPFVVALASAVEKSMKLLVFDPFRDINRIDSNSRTQLEQASNEDREKLQRFASFMYRGGFLELGGMEHVLKLLTGRTAKRIQILQKLNNFLLDGGLSKLLSRDILDSLATLTKARNSAAHSDSFSREEAIHVKSEVLNVLQVLVLAKSPCSHDV